MVMKVQEEKISPTPYPRGYKQNLTQPPYPHPSHPQNTRQTQQWVTKSNINMIYSNFIIFWLKIHFLACSKIFNQKRGFFAILSKIPNFW